VIVRWLPRARRELWALRGYVARDQPAAAMRIAQQILTAVDRLGQYPFYGRAAAWDSRGLLRELPVAGTPFVVVYEVNETVGAVVVLRVVHGAQRRGLE
jgi:toxin ParE1/3/4